jgi:hypothetical protein
VQLPVVAGSEAWQLLVSEYDEAPVPVIAMLEIVRAAVPVLVMAIDCDAEGVPTLVAVNVNGPGEKVMAGASPVPVRATLWGDPAALSVILTAALNVPPTEGVNVSVTAQFALAAIDAPQVLPVMANDVELVPASAMLVSVSEAVPVLVRVSVCGALVDPAFAEKGIRAENERAGAGGAVPLPVSVMVWGEPGTLSVTVTVAVKELAAVGRKPKVSVQLDPAGSGAVVLQAFVRVKAVGLVPPRAMLVKLIAALPALVSVTTLGLALVPVTCGPKATVVLESVSAVTLGTLAEPPPPHPAMRKKQEARTASERFLRSMGT